MIKYILTSLIFISVHAWSQELNFDQRFVQCEDQWVAFQPDSTGEYTFGFIYIDSQAGLTFDFAGTFTISAKGNFVLKYTNKEISIKTRLEPNKVLVAVIPESHYNELKITRYPEWLKIYQKDLNSIERLYKWGYRYNAWGECTRALEFLEKARKIDPEFKDLRVELGYSYNCLKQFEKAALILEEAVKAEPLNAYINKELIYTQIQNNQLDKAIATYRKVLTEVPDKTYNAENAFNILGGYFHRQDKMGFSSWLFETQIEKDPNFKEYVEALKNQIGH